MNSTRVHSSAWTKSREALLPESGPAWRTLVEAEIRQKLNDECCESHLEMERSTVERCAKVADFSADDASGSAFCSNDEEDRKLWKLVEERHRQDAAAIRALASPAPAKPIEKPIAAAPVEPGKD